MSDSKNIMGFIYDQLFNRHTTVAETTIEEEIANSVTHAVGIGLSIAGLVILLIIATRYGDIWQIVSFAIFGSSLILQYLASTLYHGVQPADPKIKRLFRIFDHSAIYLLIAGTYTPFTLVSLRGTVGWTMFGVVWAIAIIGIVIKTISVGKYDVFTVAAYLVMGWISVLGYKQMLVAVPPQGILFLVLGGIIYMAGIVFFAWEKLPYNHAIWHVFVLGGSVCHFIAVMNLVSVPFL